MSEHEDPGRTPEKPDDRRGSHNRLGYASVDETDASSDRESEEEVVAEEVDHPNDRAWPISSGTSTSTTP